MSVIVKVHHVGTHRKCYSPFKYFPFSLTPRPTPLDLRPFPQCKQHELRDGCDKLAEDPAVEPPQGSRRRHGRLRCGHGAARERARAEKDVAHPG